MTATAHPHQRVVITGRGAITSLGHTWPDTWAHLKQGHSGIRPLSSLDTTDLPVTIGAEITGFSPEEYLPKKLARRIDSSVHIAIVAAMEALQEAKLDITEDIS